MDRSLLQVSSVKPGYMMLSHRVPGFFFDQNQRHMNNKKKSTGRPPRADKASDKLITFRATEIERDRFNETAKEHGMTGSEYLRSLIPSEVFESKEDDSHVFYPNQDGQYRGYIVMLSIDEIDMLREISKHYNMKGSDVVRELIQHHHEYMVKWNMLKNS